MLESASKFWICWKQQVFCLIQNHFYVIAVEENAILGQRGLMLSRLFLETANRGQCSSSCCVHFVSLQCCPAGLVFAVQLQVWFRSLDQPLAALLNAESQGRAGDTSITQICAALVHYLLKTGNPSEVTCTSSVVDRDCLAV